MRLKVRGWLAGCRLKCRRGTRNSGLVEALYTTRLPFLTSTWRSSHAPSTAHSSSPEINILLCRNTLEYSFDACIVTPPPFPRWYLRVGTFHYRFGQYSYFSQCKCLADNFLFLPYILQKKKRREQKQRDKYHHVWRRISGLCTELSECFLHIRKPWIQPC